MSVPILVIPTATSQFAVSINGLNGRTSVSTNSDCTVLVIDDTSNYVSNTDPGHAPSDFSSFRRILIEHYKGTVINLSSIGDGDVVIPPASSGINQFTQAVTSGDGRYDITIRAVPDWNQLVNYQAADDYVFVPGASLPTSGKWYQCIQNNTFVVPAGNPLFWKEVTEDELPVKYNSTTFIVLDCALLKCLNELVECAVCKQEDVFCDDNAICTNACFLDAAKLQMIYYGIQIDVQNQNEEAVDKKFDMVSKICGCNPSTTCC